MDKIKQLVDQVAAGDAKRETVEAHIRQHLRKAIAGKDSAQTAKTRVLLGDLLLAVGEPTKAGREFLAALADEPHCVAAMTGLAESLLCRQRFPQAEQWLETACWAAERRNDHAGHLAALDLAARVATHHHDDGATREAYRRMCGLIEAAPRMGGVPMLSSESLLQMGKGHIALPYLTSAIGHLLREGYSAGPIALALRQAVRAYRQSGLDTNSTSSVLGELAALADSDQTRRRYCELLQSISHFYASEQASGVSD